MTLKAYILAAAFILVAGIIIKAYRGRCRFNNHMRKSDYTVDFTKKKKL